MNRAAPTSTSLDFGPQSCASTANATVGGWPSGSTVFFTPMLFLEVLNAKQGNCMYNFSSLWYDTTGYRTPTYRVQSEHSTTGSRTRGMTLRKANNIKSSCVSLYWLECSYDYSFSSSTVVLDRRENRSCETGKFELAFKQVSLTFDN